MSRFFQDNPPVDDNPTLASLRDNMKALQKTVGDLSGKVDTLEKQVFSLEEANFILNKKVKKSMASNNSNKKLHRHPSSAEEIEEKKKKAEEKKKREEEKRKKALQSKESFGGGGKNIVALIYFCFTCDFRRRFLRSHLFLFILNFTMTVLWSC